MNLKKLGMALAAVLALGAVLASSALGAATTSDVQFYTGTSPGTLLSGSESIAVTGSSELETTVAGTALKLKSTETECVGCTIKNEGGTGLATGRLVFKNVTVTSPATCAVEGGKIETKPLEAKPDYMIAGTEQSYITFDAEEGEVFATVKLVKGSGACAISGSYNVTGSTFLKTVNGTGIFAVSQGVRGSVAIDTEAGSALKFGGVAAHFITPDAAITLSGAKKGQAFATK